MADPSTEATETGKATTGVDSLAALLPLIIEKAIEGISRSIPDIIDQQLAQRGVVSVAGSDNIEDRDADAQIQLGDADAQIQPRDAGAPTKNMAVGASNEGDHKSVKSFDNVSTLLGKRKRDNQPFNKENSPPLIMSEEILTSLDDELGIDEKTDININDRLSKQIEHSYLEASAEAGSLNKIMKLYSMPGNLQMLAVPKLNREIEITSGFQNNDQFVSSKEKSLYSSQNYLAKAMAIIAKIGDDILADSDSGNTINHKDVLQKCIHAITLVGHVQAEHTRKRKNNVRNIVSTEYAALCGPKPGSKAAMTKPKNIDSKFLLGDNLKSDAKLAKAANDMFVKSSYHKRSKYDKKANANSYSGQGHFLYHGHKSQKKSQNHYKPLQYYNQSNHKHNNSNQNHKKNNKN